MGQRRQKTFVFPAHQLVSRSSEICAAMSENASVSSWALRASKARPGEAQSTNNWFSSVPNAMTHKVMFLLFFAIVQSSLTSLIHDGAVAGCWARALPLAV
jgi:hypothetical protein